jgi:hypothetical protein
MGSKDSGKFGQVKVTGVVMFQSGGWRFALVECSLDSEEVR